MANMDYPGPCLSCSAVDGCAGEEQKKAAAAHYCKGLELELNAWKARLYDVVVDIGDLDAADKDKVADAMALIKSTVRELDAVAEKIKTECPSDMAGAESEIGGKLETLRVNYTKALEVISPGWFGG